ncbi:MAG: hypothetical protein QM760_21585 [Nibricoccus sp.]
MSVSVFEHSPSERRTPIALPCIARPSVSNSSTMKTHAPATHALRFLLAAGLLLVISQSASALSPRSSSGFPDRVVSTPSPAQFRALTVAAHPKTPAETLLAEIKQTPYSARSALREKLKLAEAQFDEKLPEWEAQKSNLPSEKKSEADAVFKQLVRDREILRQKIDTVESASVETWNSAKDELYTSLQNTISTYNRLKAIFQS